MRLIIYIFLFAFSKLLQAQPILLKNNFYTHMIGDVSYDPLSKVNYYSSALAVCGTWGSTITTCKLIEPSNSVFYVSPLQNYINKFKHNDYVMSAPLSSSLVAGPTGYNVSSPRWTYAQKTESMEGFLYTNIGYNFRKLDTASFTTIWSYDVSGANQTISSFEVKGDSVFILQSDSAASLNYYSLIVKNKYNGLTVPYTSIQSSNPTSAAGAIQGRVLKTLLIGNKMILAGVFSASVSGVFVANNLVSIDVSTGQLSAAPATFTNADRIYDLELYGNKIYVAGNFTSVSGQTRSNLAVLDLNLNLLPDLIDFTGNGSPNTIYIDDICFYDSWMIAKGFYNAINTVASAFFDTYHAEVVNTENGAVASWTFQLPGSSNGFIHHLFKTAKNKLYINRFFGNTFNVYCLPPLLKSANILHSNSSASANNFSLCIPAINSAPEFTAPINEAETYSWTYSGSNATITPVGDGKRAKVEFAQNATNGVLSVYGTNDCGLTTPNSTLQILVKDKPQFTLPASPQLIHCLPDSTLLNTSSTNTSTIIEWKSSSNNATVQPVYVKLPGNYRCIITDTLNTCSDSGLIVVKNFKAKPNAKILSHNYISPFSAIDTITCAQPSATIQGGSDTSNVTITWRSLTNYSVHADPLMLSSQNNLKLIVTRNDNQCADSSMIVLINENKSYPSVNTSTAGTEINCSVYTASLNALFSPPSCSAIWTTNTFTATNPATTNYPGKYYIEVKDSVNGCETRDSIEIVFSNLLLLNTNTDTLVCAGATVPLYVYATGTISGITYFWSTGAGSPSTTVNPVITSVFTVTANSGTCAGTASVTVKIPVPIKDSIVAFRSCENNEGTIVAFAKGGRPPYMFSLNNLNSFTPQNTFTAVPFGNYNVQIKDSLSCILSSSVSLNASNILPEPLFLASSKNNKGDTAVLVNISTPLPDSTQWILPPSTKIISQSANSILIAFADTGAFEISLKGYYGSCVRYCTRILKWSEADSSFADLSNLSGIDTLIIFPNPNNGLFTMQALMNKKQNAAVHIYDVQGNLHYEKIYYGIKQIEESIDISTLPAGNYILRLTAEFDSENKTLILTN